ncbi:MAG: diguanylate cyclase [Candidatus Sulfotelmatobacter sp.]|jgi:diguanylate cyclase (GGDEF)-like protein/PAS domain S-box-containing protein
MPGTYDLRLVALSVVLAMVSSYAALDLAARLVSTQGRARQAWLSCGAVAMGLGIWAMHYVGMLALTMPMPVFYHLPTVLLSLLAAVGASAVALFVVSRPQMDIWQEVLGSLVMGGGIAAMHYIGMAAMRCPAETTYDLKIVALSIVLAIAISFVALKLAFRVRDVERISWRKSISALVMGSAIPLMHYTGMRAASFRSSTIAPDLTDTIGISMIGIGAISGTTFLVLAGTIASAFFDRFLDSQKGSLRIAKERESYFHTMADAIPEIIWTADPNGDDDFFNCRCFEYTGLTLDQMRRSGWAQIVHPDDLEDCWSKWRNALRVGAPYEVEYRLLGKDGFFQWFLGRASPIRDGAGKIIKWFGTCTNIEVQKQNQQVLEEQIRERTVELADANALLQSEMSEKDSARNEFDQQNERMMTELKKRTDRATMLAKMGELLQSCINREEVFAAALGFAPKIFPVARGAIVLLNAERNLAEVIGSWSACQFSSTEFEAADCWALRTGQPHLVVAGDTTAPCLHAAGVKNTYLCIPILAQGETLGIMHFQSTDEAQQMEASELSLKTTFAGQVGLSIANIRLRDALRTQSVRDALTGLYNRRYLEEALDREIRRAGRAGQPLGLMMIDLDHFKRFNDTYGHDAGDAVLREAAAFLLRSVRAEDFVCRFGGEEFVVILPTANREGAHARAERLRLKMKDMAVQHQGRSLGMVSFSIGVAAFPEHGASPQELMAAADAALYEAKRGGRDRVVVATPKGEVERTIPDAAKPAAVS